MPIDSSSDFVISPFKYALRIFLVLIILPKIESSETEPILFRSFTAFLTSDAFTFAILFMAEYFVINGKVN